MRKIFHSSSNIIANDSDIDKAFESMHQSVMTKGQGTRNRSGSWFFEKRIF